MLNILNKKIAGLVLITLVGSGVFYQASKEDTANSVGGDANEKIVDQIREIVGEDEEENTPDVSVVTPVIAPVKPTTTTTTPTTPKPSGITMTEIAKHNSKSDCWSAINGSVYDLTSWIPNHPGGEKRILILCGKDGSKDYNGAHGTKTKMFNILSGFKIGSLAS
jgi:cytochrome b involved in lipid metabolism